MTSLSTISALAFHIRGRIRNFLLFDVFHVTADRSLRRPATHPPPNGHCRCAFYFNRCTQARNVTNVSTVGGVSLRAALSNCTFKPSTWRFRTRRGTRRTEREGKRWRHLSPLLRSRGPTHKATTLTRTCLTYNVLLYASVLFISDRRQLHLLHYFRY